MRIDTISGLHTQTFFRKLITFINVYSNNILYCTLQQLKKKIIFLCSNKQLHIQKTMEATFIVLVQLLAVIINNGACFPTSKKKAYVFLSKRADLVGIDLCRHVMNYFIMNMKFYLNLIEIGVFWVNTYC